MLARMSTPTLPLYGAIEAGGTKFECALARGAESILALERIPTGAPDQTFDAVIRFFEVAQQQHGAIEAFGLASFGPLDLNPRSPGFGQLLATPKAGWSHYDMTARLRRHFGRSVYLDTDVNAAALAEWRARDAVNSLVYVTVGTGIGGGVVFDGQSRREPWHPEMGHIRVQRHARDETFAGVCPFHRDCLEGLANGPAIVARWGRPMSALLEDALACEIVGDYLGQLAATIALLLAPDCIVFGGGVMSGGGLLPQVRRSAQRQLGGYLLHPRLREQLQYFIVPPALGERSGLLGALALAAAGTRIGATAVSGGSDGHDAAK
jgi:fructokinase